MSTLRTNRGYPIMKNIFSLSSILVQVAAQNRQPVQQAKIKIQVVAHLWIQSQT